MNVPIPSKDFPIAAVQQVFSAATAFDLEIDQAKRDVDLRLAKLRSALKRASREHQRHRDTLLAHIRSDECLFTKSELDALIVQMEKHEKTTAENVAAFDKIFERSVALAASQSPGHKAVVEHARDGVLEIFADTGRELEETRICVVIARAEKYRDDAAPVFDDAAEVKKFLEDAGVA